MDGINNQQQINDPFYWTHLIDPQGNHVKASPENVDALLAEGYQFLNPDREVELRTHPAEIPLKVKASEIKPFIEQGYKTFQEETYKQQVKDYKKAITPEEPTEPGFLEKAGSLVGSFASGATFGVSDVLGRLANELIGIATDDDSYATKAAETLREIRESTGLAGIGTEILGGILTGGAVTSLGKTAASRIGLAATEGALAGLGGTAARDVLDDPDITAQSYLFNAGIGAVLGAGLQKVGEKLAALKPVRNKILIDDVPVNFHKDLTPLEDFKFTGEMPVPISVDGKYIGEVVLSKNNPLSYHPGGKYGISLESIKLKPEAPEGSTEAILKSLTDRFGTITSPSTIERLDDVKSIFTKYGTNKPTRLGDNFYEINASSLPIEVKPESLESSFNKAIYKLLDKVPDESKARYRELFDKITDANNGLFRKDFFEYIADPRKGLSKAVKALDDSDDLMKNYVIQAERVRKEIGHKIDEVGRTNLNEHLVNLQIKLTEMFESVIEKDNRELTKILSNTYNKIDDILKTENNIDAWEKAFNLKREFFENRASLFKSAMLNSDEKRAVNDLYTSLIQASSAGEVLGKNADLFRTIDVYASNLMKKLKEFDKAFKTNGKIDPRKVNNAFNTHSQGTVMARTGILDEYRAALSQFAQSVADAQERGLIKGIDLPDIKELVPRLNEINKLYEFNEVRKILTSIRANSPASGVAQGAASMLGSVAGANLGQQMGIPSLILSSLGALFANKLVVNKADPFILLQKLDDPSTMMKFSQNLAEKVREGSRKIAPRAIPKMSRSYIASTLGLKYNQDEDDNNTYVQKARERLVQLNNPDVIRSSLSDLPAEVTESVVQNTDRIINYALNKLPSPKPYRKLSIAETIKADNLLLALANPRKAAEIAVLSNNSDMMKHVAIMYPKVAEQVREMTAAKLKDEEIDNTLTPINTKLRLQKVTGINYAGTSNSSLKRVQNLFKTGDNKPKPVNVNVPALPGDAIQDQIV